MKNKKAARKLEHAAKILKGVLEDTDAQAAPYVKSASEAVHQAIQKLEAVHAAPEKAAAKEPKDKKAKKDKKKTAAKKQSKK